MSSTPPDADDVNAAEWVRLARYIPRRRTGYDYQPFCKALIETHHDLDEYGRPQSPGFTERPGQGGVIRRGGTHATIEEIPEHLLPKKDLSKGSWTYVDYIPAWMDPDHSETLLKTYEGTVRRNTVSDAVYNLRPAMRLDDTIRNPTAYAQRFGIAQDRRDGRSRMSPTWSVTRNPLDDLTNQISMLGDEDRKRAEEMSRQIYATTGRVPMKGQEILPEAMDALLQQHGLMTNAQLVDQVRQAAESGMSLDEMVDNLERKNPEIRKAHQVFLDNAKRDQDYQRVILSGITTDELVQNNVLTMSDENIMMDLDNPIHRLFDRDHWEDCSWKGSDPRSPRCAYSINGVRAEWNAATNDELWAAMQPALRLASLVLESNPPHLEAIFDMTTRQPISSLEDNRHIKDTPTLSKYVRVEDIDLGATYAELRELKERFNYDWRTHTLAALEKYLKFDICSGFQIAGYQDWDDPFGTATYACTKTQIVKDSQGAPTPILTIFVAAEIIWPLLVPQYSASEKLTCSFCLASTLLHEFAHAIGSGQVFLMEGHFVPIPNQSYEITCLLSSLARELVSRTDYMEPYFEDGPREELGADFERDLWSLTCCLPTMLPHIGMPRGHMLMTIALCFDPYPQQLDMKRISRMNISHVYRRPMPIEYMAKLFRKSFWEGDFRLYGHNALRLLPDNRVLKSVMTDHLTDKGTDVRLYGHHGDRFLKTVLSILWKSRNHVLANYLQNLLWEQSSEYRNLIWWSAESESWKHHWFFPLLESIQTLDRDLISAEDINAQLYVGDQTAAYNAYVASVDPFDILLPPIDWQRDMMQKWTDMLRNGGRLMQGVLDVDYWLEHDIGSMQNMVYHSIVAKNLGDSADLMKQESRRRHPLELARERLVEFHDHAVRLASLVNTISRIPQLRNDENAWKKWQARLEAHGQSYQNLIDEIDNVDNINKDDIKWKAKFNRLVTAAWKPGTERYLRMAIREYRRAPQIVRDTIDEFIYHLQDSDEPHPLDVEVDADTDKDIADFFDELTGIGNEPPRQQPLFDFKLPTTQGGTLVTVQPKPKPATPKTPQNSKRDTGVRFGVPGGRAAMAAEELNKSPSRRVQIPNRAGAAVAQQPATAAQRSSAFRDYSTNLLSAPGGRLSTPEAANLFQSGTSTPIEGGGNTQFGPGGSGQQQTILPFPHAYADRAVLTSDVTATGEQGKLSGQTGQERQQATGAYKSTRLWQDRVDDPDSDDEVPAQKKQK